jgi:Uma2 family endonuclease
MGLPARRRATLDDLLRGEREGHAFEILGGELVEKAAPDQEHGGAASAINSHVFDRYNRRGGGGRHPGGWWIRTEVDILFSPDDVLRPDLSGWRRDRVPEMPAEWPVPVPPDWVCEILSARTAARDLGPKRDLYHRANVGHYWVVDRSHRLLLVYRRAPEAYQLVLTGSEAETIHAEPFADVGLFVGRLFGLDPPDEA